MLRPTPGELLRDVRRELRDQVLPALPAGTAARQVRAALHVLDQLARSWDLQLDYLAADNADLDLTLDEMCRTTGVTRHRRASAAVPAPPGVNSPRLRDLMAENISLQAELEAFQAGAGRHSAVQRVLLDLHTRMAARAMRAGGMSEQEIDSTIA